MRCPCQADHRSDEGRRRVRAGRAVISRLIDKKAVIELHVADAVKKGAKVVIGGKRAAQGGSFFEPTVLTDVTNDMFISKEGDLRPGRAVLTLQDRRSKRSSIRLLPRCAARRAAMSYDHVRVMVGLSSRKIPSSRFKIGGEEARGISASAW